ncbi:50S ribosomal protein L17 [Candidatus Parcubacteria bacterium]|nr:MAG: 50S ribosomal protein L17 [Candidatus Parcubacteria bacterium]
MRHRKKGRKFHRITGRRKSFLRNLAANFILSGKIETTVARAKSLRPLVERLITIARRGDLASRRLVLSRLHHKDATHKLVDEIAPRYLGRPGGYLRIRKLMRRRKRDGADLARVEFVETEK